MTKVNDATHEALTCSTEAYHGVKVHSGEESGAAYGGGAHFQQLFVVSQFCCYN